MSVLKRQSFAFDILAFIILLVDPLDDAVG